MKFSLIFELCFYRNFWGEFVVYISCAWALLNLSTLSFPFPCFSPPSPPSPSIGNFVLQIARSPLWAPGISANLRRKCRRLLDSNPIPTARALWMSKQLNAANFEYTTSFLGSYSCFPYGGEMGPWERGCRTHYLSFRTSQDYFM